MPPPPKPPSGSSGGLGTTPPVDVVPTIGPNNIAGPPAPGSPPLPRPGNYILPPNSTYPPGTIVTVPGPGVPSASSITNPGALPVYPGPWTNPGVSVTQGGAMAITPQGTVFVPGTDTLPVRIVPAVPGGTITFPQGLGIAVPVIGLPPASGGGIAGFFPGGGIRPVNVYPIGGGVTGPPLPPIGLPRVIPLITPADPVPPSPRPYDLFPYSPLPDWVPAWPQITPPRIIFPGVMTPGNVGPPVTSWPPIQDAFPVIEDVGGQPVVTGGRIGGGDGGGGLRTITAQ